MLLEFIGLGIAGASAIAAGFSGWWAWKQTKLAKRIVPSAWGSRDVWSKLPSSSPDCPSRRRCEASPLRVGAARTSVKAVASNCAALLEAPRTCLRKAPRIWYAT